MIDWFVLLAPICLLAVVALLGFVGCDIVLGLKPVSPVTADPTFDPMPGTYDGTQFVGLSDATSNATIYYTTDASNPTIPPTGSTQMYSGKITVTTTTVIKAIASSPNAGNSNVAEGDYVINPITFVRFAENVGTSNSLTMATNALPQVNPGDLIVVWLWYNSLAQTISSVSDTAGNTYQKAVGPTPGAGALAGWQQEIWYAKNVMGAGINVPVTVTATFSSMPGASFERAISAHEYAGASATAPIDVTSAAIGATANASSGSVATNTAGLIFGAAIFGSGGTPGSGFMQRSTLKGNVTEDGPITVQGSAEATFSNTAQDWIAQMVTLK
jgi:Chitobiase/beta-hexosaminidase C-terminal domain